MPDHSLIVLARFLHVAGGTVWAGGAIFVGAFLLPAVRAVGEPGAVVMRELTAVRRAPYLLGVAAAVAIVSGAYLYWVDSAGLDSAWTGSRLGASYSVGAAAGVLGFLIGGLVNVPAAQRIGALAEAVRQGGARPTPEQAATLAELTRRLLRGTRAVALLVLIATAAMAVARYL